MWDKTKAYKNHRTVKRGYDLMFENFFFYFLFLLSKLLSSFNPLESFFLLFHVSDSKSLYMEIQVESGGAGAPSRPPLAPPLSITLVTLCILILVLLLSQIEINSTGVARNFCSETLLKNYVQLCLKIKTPSLFFPALPLSLSVSASSSSPHSHCSVAHLLKSC